MRAARRISRFRVSCRVARVSYVASRNRRGAAMVETAISILVFLITTFGIFELAIANFNEHLVNNAARQAARIASVHGTMGPPKMTQWGPATMSITASDTGELGSAIQPFLTGVDL